MESSVPEKISVCDLLKNDSSEIVRKLESTVPTFIQSYTDLFSGYLHLYENLFGTCYIAEKEFFDKLNIDQKVLSELKRSTDNIKKQALVNIDLGMRAFDTVTKMRIATIHTFDSYMQIMMETCARTLAEFNRSYANIK